VLGAYYTNPTFACEFWLKLFSIVPVARNMDHSKHVSENTRRLVEEVLAWQCDNNTQRIPNQHCTDAKERSLGNRLKNALLRRAKSRGSRPSERRLSAAEVALVNSIPGTPSAGCAVNDPQMQEVNAEVDAQAGSPSVEPTADTERTPQKKRRVDEPSSTNSKYAADAAADISTPLPPAAAIALAQSCRKSPHPLTGCPDEGDGEHSLLDTSEPVIATQQPQERAPAKEDESQLRAAAGPLVQELYDYIGKRSAETGEPEYRPHSRHEVHM
jgi:hypothetical protein